MNNNSKTLVSVLVVVVAVFAGRFIMHHNDISVEPMQFNVEEVCLTPWNDTTGLFYRTGPGYVGGAESFALVNPTTVAYLTASNEIRIFDCTTGTLISSFSVGEYSDDLLFDNDKFFVLKDRTMSVYTKAGDELYSVPVPSDLRWMLGRSEGTTYIHTPKLSSIAVERDGQAIIGGEEIAGSVGEHDTYIDITRASIGSSPEYTVSFTDRNGKTASGTFSEDHIGGLIPIGSIGDKIFMHITTIFADSSYKQYIVCFTKIGTELRMTARLQIPNVNYVHTTRDFLVTDDALYNIITAPDGAHIFKLTLENMDAMVQDYPVYLMENSYHYNDHMESGDAM